MEIKVADPIRDLFPDLSPVPSGSAGGSPRLVWHLATNQLILFASREDKQATEDEASDYANVPLKGFKRQVKTKLFTPASPAPWPPPGLLLPDLDGPMHRILGVGATMAMLFAVGNRGDDAIAASRLAFDPVEVAPDSPSDPMLSGLRHWVTLQAPGESDGLQSRLLSGVLDAIIEAKTRAEVDQNPADETTDTHQAVLEYLDGERSRLSDERLRAALESVPAKLDAKVRAVLMGR